MTNTSLDTADVFLAMAKDRPLREIYDDFGSDKILAILESVGIHTYGELLEYAQHNYFSDLPGIGAHGAEDIHKFIEWAEGNNKMAAVLKLYRTQNRLSKLGELSQQLAEAFKVPEK